MQAVCRFSRRWHQQFCQSPSFMSHQKCLQMMMPMRTYRQATRRTRNPSSVINSISQNDRPQRFRPADAFSEPEEYGDLIVQEFEQHGSNASTRVKLSPGNELDSEAAEVLKELQDVDRQLSILKQGPFGPQSDFMLQLPSDQRETLLKALADEGINPAEEQEYLDLAEIDRIMEEEEETTSAPKRLAVSLGTSRVHQALVNHFNKALIQANSNTSDTLKVLTLWKWYLRCQQTVPGFSQYVSDHVWDFLWTSQSALKVRQRHLVVLGRDFLSTGRALRAEQHLEYIEALHISGDTAAAISSWEDLRTDRMEDWAPEVVFSFYSIGIRLYSAADRPAKAQNISSSALEKGVNPRILLDVIAGWIRAKVPVKAWSSYLKMRALLGPKMPSELYEKASDILLDNSQTEMALAVFKDLVANVRGTGENTLQSYCKSLGRTDLVGNPQAVEDAINQVSLTVLTALPQQYQNKFFFASWIKKLIGQERIDAASMVVDLMYERGIRPDPTHLNGIIGAWLRDKNPQSQERASQLAWEMIYARINQVQRRKNNASTAEIGKIFRKVIPHENMSNVWSKPINLERPVPPANIETFSLLFDYSEQRFRWKDFEKLTQIMIGPAELKPNSFVVNKWLNLELQQRSFGKFWALFFGLEEQIVPNLETYSLAWQAIATQQTPYGQSRHCPISFQQLFGKIMKWQAHLRPRDWQEAKDGFTNGFYKEIIRSFSYSLQIPDTICAMQGMYAAFSLTPNDASVQLITSQVARMLHRPESSQIGPGRRRRPHVKLIADQTMLKDIADIVATIEAKHKIELAENGQAQPEELENTSTDVAQKLRLDVMTEFLILIVQRMKKEAENPSKNLRDVAKVMNVGVSHIDMETAIT